MRNNMEHKIKFCTLVNDNGHLVETNIRYVKQSDIAKCPFCIMVPEHYHDDGTCKCSDAEYRKTVMKKWGYTKRDFIRVGLERRKKEVPAELDPKDVRRIV
jgi:hypothetical protein